MDKRVPARKHGGWWGMRGHIIGITNNGAQNAPLGAGAPLMYPTFRGTAHSPQVGRSQGQTPSTSTPLLTGLQGSGDGTRHVRRMGPAGGAL